MTLGNSDFSWTCTVNSWSATQVVATVPVGMQSGVVYVVTQAGAQSNLVSLTVAAPNITSVSPTTVSPGGQVTITGTNFGSAQGTVTWGTGHTGGTAR